MQNVASRKYRDWFSKRAPCAARSLTVPLSVYLRAPWFLKPSQASGSWYDHELPPGTGIQHEGEQLPNSK
jgi:hypothetical protein